MSVPAKNVTQNVVIKSITYNTSEIKSVDVLIAIIMIYIGTRGLLYLYIENVIIQKSSIAMKYVYIPHNLPIIEVIEVICGLYIDKCGDSGFSNIDINFI